ncbi:heme peroxidase [Cynara cardunculus var. scolymus]|uniref:peroxidase n=1 Tax=Cynara cardunculus var. scolymus TaxID=59895 RepID=A0A124SBH4_CYNCS|nr:heme peroxidase [Cynara cardunculus var. scolymus]
MSGRSFAVGFMIMFLFMNLTGYCYGGLQFGFYNGKCGASDVEDIVRKVVISKFFNDRTITPALLRLQFHDCFVNGCDGSILLDGTNSEKTASPNLSVRGYDVIDAAKTAVERACPGVVSCADIIVIATRDVVSLIYIQCVCVLCIGGHTIGIAHCSLFSDRLYNFNNTGKPDQTMDLSLLTSLRRTCPQGATVDRTANLDQNLFSSQVVDKSFYSQIIKGRGVLQFDQQLALDNLSKSTVAAIAGSSDFTTKFGQAMVKLGALKVLTDTQGEIRRSCRSVNSQTLTTIAFIFLNLTGHCYAGDLRYGFYNGKCRFSDVEDIGCDASILLDGRNTEKTAQPNLGVRGYDVIDAAKAAVERVCPGVVSCADIIVMATRDVVSLVSKLHLVHGSIYFFMEWRRQILCANRKKRWIFISCTKCFNPPISFFIDRLYNFNNTGKPDPTMDLSLLTSLKRTCPQNATVDRTANLDQNPLSSQIVDKSFYSQIIMRRGVLQFDHQLASDRLSKTKVAAIARSSDFATKFGQAMVKMGVIQALTGTQGEIRKSCRAVNPRGPLSFLFN